MNSSTAARTAPGCSMFGMWPAFAICWKLALGGHSRTDAHKKWGRCHLVHPTTPRLGSPRDTGADAVAGRRVRHLRCRSNYHLPGLLGTRGMVIELGNTPPMKTRLTALRW